MSVGDVCVNMYVVSGLRASRSYCEHSHSLLLNGCMRSVPVCDHETTALAPQQRVKTLNKQCGAVIVP